MLANIEKKSGIKYWEIELLSAFFKQEKDKTAGTYKEIEFNIET